MAYGTKFIQVETKGDADGVRTLFRDWDQMLIKAADEGFPVTRESLGGSKDKWIEVTIRTNDVAAARQILTMSTRQIDIQKFGYRLRYNFEEAKHPR